MYCKRLNRLKCIPQDILHRLHAERLDTVEQLLMVDEYSLIRRLDMDYIDVRRLIQEVSMEVAPESMTLSEWRASSDRTRNLKTGLQPLDTFLRGGLRQGTITEIVGPSGVGKTQFAMSMAVEAAMTCDGDDDLNGGEFGSVVYMDTEKIMKTQDALSRLAEIGYNRKGVRAEEFMNRVRIFYMEDTDSMLQFIENQLPDLIVEHNVRLIVLDSIAALLRKEFESIVHRQDMLGQLASKLKFIAEEFKTPILVTNHVTVRTRTLTDQYRVHRYQEEEEVDQGATSLASTSSSDLTAALGIAWWHMVNTRLVFEEIDITHLVRDLVENSIKSFRQITIAKSPLTGVHSIPYKIDARGVQVHEAAMQLSRQLEHSTDGGTHIVPRNSTFANTNASDLQHDTVSRQIRKQQQQLRHVLN